MSDLVTARLLLHPLSPAEARGVVARAPDDDVLWAPGYPAAGDAAGAGRFLGVCAYSGDPRPFGAYEIRRRTDGYAIGGVGFHQVPDENGGVTIGYGLIPTARGAGYAREALAGLLSFAWERGVSSVYGDTTHDNLASQRVMTAVGMRLLGEDESLRYYRIACPDAKPSGRHLYVPRL